MTPFEFRVRIPADMALAAMIRDVVAHGARQAGASDEKALEFACRVEDATRDIAAAANADRTVSVVIRLEDGPLQVVVTDGGTPRTFSLDI